MRRERLRRGALVPEPTEIDDLFEPVRGRGDAKVGGGTLVARIEVGAGRQRMHEVVRDVDVAERGAGLFGIEEIGAYHLHYRAPFLGVQLLRRAGETTDRVARGNEFRDEPAADVAGRTGDRDATLLGHRCCHLRTGPGTRR